MSNTRFVLSFVALFAALTSVSCSESAPAVGTSRGDAGADTGANVAADAAADAPVTSAPSSMAFFYQAVATDSNAVRTGSTTDGYAISSSGQTLLTWQARTGTKTYGDPVFSRLANGRWAMSARSNMNDPRGGQLFMYHESDCPKVDDAAVKVIGQSTASQCQAGKYLVTAKNSQFFAADGGTYVFVMVGSKVHLVHVGDGTRSAQNLDSVCVRKANATSLAELAWGEATAVLDETQAPGMFLSDPAIARRPDGTWVLFVKGISSSSGCKQGSLCELCARNIYRTTSTDLVHWSSVEKVVERASVPEAANFPDGSVWLYWQNFAEACDASDLQLATRAPIYGAREEANLALSTPKRIAIAGEKFETDTSLHYATNGNPILLPNAAAKAALDACIAK